MELTISELKQLTERDAAQAPSLTNLGLCITIADRGHVWVGTVTREGDFTRISRAATVRKWGTTNGLGQLANEGPQPATRLDPVCEVLVPQRAIIAHIPCKESAWTGKL